MEGNLTNQVFIFRKRIFCLDRGIIYLTIIFANYLVNDFSWRFVFCRLSFLTCRFLVFPSICFEGKTEWHIKIKIRFSKSNQSYISDPVNH